MSALQFAALAFLALSGAIAAGAAGAAFDFHRGSGCWGILLSIVWAGILGACVMVMP